MNKIIEDIGNDIFHSFDNIVNDILKQKDYAISMAFTKQIGELLRKNGVIASYIMHEYNEQKDDAFTKNYGVLFDSIDFSEHDKKFLEEIEKLEKELKDKDSKIENLQILNQTLHDEVKRLADSDGNNELNIPKRLIDGDRNRAEYVFNVLIKQFQWSTREAYSLSQYMKIYSETHGFSVNSKILKRYMSGKDDNRQ